MLLKHCSWYKNSCQMQSVLILHQLYQSFFFQRVCDDVTIYIIFDNVNDCEAETTTNLLNLKQLLA